MILLASFLLKPTVVAASAAWGVLLVEGEYVAAAVAAAALLVLVLVGAGRHRSVIRGNGAEGNT